MFVSFRHDAGQTLRGFDLVPLSRYWVVQLYPGRVPRPKSRMAARCARPWATRSCPTGSRWIIAALASMNAVGDEAGEAAVRHRDGEGDNPLFCRTQIIRRLVQLLVLAEPRAQALGTEAVALNALGTNPIFFSRAFRKRFRRSSGSPVSSGTAPRSAGSPSPCVRCAPPRLSVLLQRLTARICCSP
jgi:hypothetical protein